MEKGSLEKKREELRTQSFHGFSVPRWGTTGCLGVLIGLFIFSASFFALRGSGLFATGQTGGKNGGVEISNEAGSKKVDVGSLPGALQSMLSKTLGANDPQYRMSRSGGGYRAVNGPNRLTATIGLDGFRVSAGPNVWGLRLTAWGAGRRLKRIEAGRAVSGSNRVDIDRNGIKEWWVNGPFGIEQGWTVANRPHEGKSRGQLTLFLRQSGNLRARHLSYGRALCVSSSSGREVWQYTGLSAYDKTGRRLPARFEATRQDVRVVVDDTRAAYPVRIDPWVQAAKLTASDGSAFNWFGSSFAVSSDGATVVVGASGATVRNNSSQGALYVFEEPASGWANGTQAAKLTASDGAVNDCLGYSVAVSADGATVVAGTPYARAGSNSAQGAVYVFTQPASGWADGTQTAKLTASDGAAYDGLGNSVAVGADGATVVAGAYGATVGGNSAQGAVYVFAQPASGWANGIQTAKLTASNGAAGDYLGDSVAVSPDGATVVAGAYGASEPVGSNRDQGAVYVFKQSASGWANGKQTAKLTASDSAAGDYSGYSVAVSSNGATVVVGTPYASVGSTVYVFTQPASGWADEAQTAKLTASDGATGNYLGCSVAVSPDGATVAAGAPYALVGNNPDQGAVYVFTQPASGWADETQTAKLTASDGAIGDYLGSSIALSTDGTTVATGAAGATVGGNADQGAVYEFQTGLFEGNGACGGSNGGAFISIPTSNLCCSGTASSVTTATGICNWNCTGLNGGTNAYCSAILIIDGVCGSSNGGSYIYAPTSGLCSSGAASSVTTATGAWSWTCTGLNGGTNASCLANIEVNGACGSSNGGTFSCAPTSGLCSNGTASSVTSATGACDWTCTGLNGGANASCSANLIVNATCGNSSGGTFGYAPTSGLCSSGTASSVTSSTGACDWTCTGLNGGANAICSANLIVNATCGNSSGGTFDYAPTSGLCSSGTASSVTSSTGACDWTCTGLNGGANAICSANLIVNATCGNSSGGTFGYAPTSGLCSSGTASSVTSSTGACDWTCTGLNGGANASCSANLIVNATCGNSSGGTFSYAPTSGLCSSGTASSVTTGTGTWNWTCTGLNDGANANCSANLRVSGACGDSNGGTFSSVPTSDLCSSGTASSVTSATGACNWTCTGLNGGANASCSADLIVNATCGNSNGGTFSSAPASDLCSSGTASSVTTGTGTWNWTCTGLNDGTNAICSASDPSAGGLWQNATDYGNGWKSLSWFGYFYMSASQWIYHLTLGWLYPIGTSTDNIWFWDPKMNTFWWTSASVYPSVYRISDGAWLYYDVGSSNPRYFFNFNTNSWETD